jgi:hypothetical protein
MSIRQQSQDRMVKLPDYSSNIAQIEKLVSEDTIHSLTYAALECRLALERICYDRLRLVHNYIAHNDLRAWQPSKIVNQLIQEVDANLSSDAEVFGSTNPVANEDPSPANFEALDWTKVGTQSGFNPKTIGKLWNGLANVALHIPVPTNSDDSVSTHGHKNKISEKVQEALFEIKRVAQGNLLTSGWEDVVRFTCGCGRPGERNMSLLTDYSIVSCHASNCDGSFEVKIENGECIFQPRLFEIVCSCGEVSKLHRKTVDRMKLNEPGKVQCKVCGRETIFGWKLYHAQINPVNPANFPK